MSFLLIFMSLDPASYNEIHCCEDDSVGDGFESMSQEVVAFQDLHVTGVDVLVFFRFDSPLVIIFHSFDVHIVATLRINGADVDNYPQANQKVCDSRDQEAIWE